MGAGRTVRGILVWVLVRDDKGLGYCTCDEYGDPQRWKVDVRTNAEGREGKGKLKKFYQRKMWYTYLMTGGVGCRRKAGYHNGRMEHLWVITWYVAVRTLRQSAILQPHFSLNSPGVAVFLNVSPVWSGYQPSLCVSFFPKADPSPHIIS